MQTLSRPWFFALIFGSLVACAPYGEIRVVKMSKTGGEMALLGERALARQKGEAEMARTCGAGKYEVLEEGEAVIGSVAETQGSSLTSNSKTIFNVPALRTSGASTTETTQKTEWRLKYTCKGADGEKQGAARIHELVVTF